MVDKSKILEWDENKNLLNYGDEGIDPFSFFYFLASKKTPLIFEEVYESVHNVFDLKGSLPRMIDMVFPVPRELCSKVVHGWLERKRRIWCTCKLNTKQPSNQEDTPPCQRILLLNTRNQSNFGMH